jgi:hypothetical protein
MGATSSGILPKFAGLAKGSGLSALANLPKYFSAWRAGEFLSNAVSSGIQIFPRLRSLFGRPASMAVGMTSNSGIHPTKMMNQSP